MTISRPWHKGLPAHECVCDVEYDGQILCNVRVYTNNSIRVCGVTPDGRDTTYMLFGVDPSDFRWQPIEVPGGV